MNTADQNQNLSSWC